MNGICGNKQITPFQGLPFVGIPPRRALPYASDNKAFSLNYTQHPKWEKYSFYHRALPYAIDHKDFSLKWVTQKTESLPRSNQDKLYSFKWVTQKAESLVVNSAGQRPARIHAHKFQAPTGRNQLFSFKREWHTQLKNEVHT
jgi:hypothetical protein